MLKKPYFHITNFFSKPVIGLEIGESAVKLAEIEKAGACIKLNWAALAEVGARSKVGDEKWKAQVIHAIGSIVSEKKSKGRKVYTVVSGRNVVVKHMVMTRIPRKELNESIKWEIGDRLPFPVETAIVDYQIVDEFREKGVEKVELMVVAIERKIIAELLSITKEAGIDLAGVTVVPIALLNFARGQSMLPPKETCILIDIGASITHMVVINKEKLLLSRGVPIGGTDITKSMTGALSADKGRITLDFPQAEKFKREHGYPIEAQYKDSPDKVKLSLVASAMRPLLEQISKEIKRSSDYVSREGVNVDSVILSGGGSKLKNISLFLAKECGVQKIRFMDMESSSTNIILDKSRCPEKEIESVLPRMTVAIGAAMTGDEQINLLATGLKSKQKAMVLNALKIYGIPAVIGIAAIIAATTFIRVKRHERSLNLTKGRYEKLRPTIDRLGRLETEYYEMRNLRSLYEHLQKSGIDGAFVLYDLASAVPENIALSSVNAYMSGDKGKLDISGTVSGVEQAEGLLAQFMVNLKNSNCFQDTQLLSSKEAPDRSNMAVNFRITATISACKNE
jgi:type IV pilus assembly protein PilM